MTTRGSSRPSLVFGLALGGVLLGHTVAYRLLLPDAHARAVELAASGHGYLSGANVVGLVASVAALAALFLGAILRTNQTTPGHIGTRLVGFQMAAFVAMEVLERIASGGGAHHLPAVLLIGLPVQAVIAVLVALFARLLLHVAAAIAGLLDRTPAWRGAVVAFVDGSSVLRRRPRTGRPPGRAPPSFLVLA
ncbi:MAG: hypothetical protein ACJ76A_04870 [Actinomycetota bacterium]